MTSCKSASNFDPTPIWSQVFERETCMGQKNELRLDANQIRGKSTTLLCSNSWSQIEVGSQLEAWDAQIFGLALRCHRAQVNARRVL